eukprot:COSAG06_NODE_5196_length_3644_cov_28.150635_3_plen_224_part_00
MITNIADACGVSSREIISPGATGCSSCVSAQRSRIVHLPAAPSHPPNPRMPLRLLETLRVASPLFISSTAAAERPPAAASETGSCFVHTKNSGSEQPDPEPQFGTRVLSSLCVNSVPESPAHAALMLRTCLLEMIGHASASAASSLRSMPRICVDWWQSQLVPRSAAQRSTAHSTQHSTAQHSTAQRSAAQRSTARSTAQPVSSHSWCVVLARRGKERDAHQR